MFGRFRLASFGRYHSSTLFNEEMHLLRNIYRNMANSFSVFILKRNCIPVMCKRRRFVFITGIQHFSKVFFNNHFNRRKHFACFVSCIYHCTLLIKVSVYVVLLLLEEIEMSGFEGYNSKRNASNEHYAKEKNFMLQVSKKTFDETHDTKTNTRLF